MVIERQIVEILRPFRLTWKNRSTSDLIWAVKLVAEDTDRICAVHKEVYAVIAKARRCTGKVRRPFIDLKACGAEIVWSAKRIPAAQRWHHRAGNRQLKMREKQREAEENRPAPDADYREDEEEIVLPDEPDVGADAEANEDASRRAYQASDGYEEQ